MMEPVSFILCNYNALDYFRFCYQSLRENLWDGHEIVLVDDGSTDGSRAWMRSLSDPRLIRHENPENIGIAYSYNMGVNLATSRTVCVLHTDMYVPPRFDERMLAGLRGRDFVCAYRAEPDLYPPSPDKAVADFGQDLATFDRAGFDAWAERNAADHPGGFGPAVFFPWMTTRRLFLRLGGVDLLFLKYMVDDDDLYLRAALAGARMGQVRDAAVYHFGSRSTRFRDPAALGHPAAPPPPDWDDQYRRSFRNFMRKWGTPPTRCWSADMAPTPPARYDIGLLLGYGSPNAAQALATLEPLTGVTYVGDAALRKAYVAAEQPRTRLDMKHRVRVAGKNEPQHDVFVFVPPPAQDPDTLPDTLAALTALPDELAKLNAPADSLLGPLPVRVTALRRHETELVTNTRIFDWNHTGTEPGFNPA
ncbi:MAG: glycosyltransferase family 2 protein [Desulfovibrionaceae bacterium]